MYEADRYGKISPHPISTCTPHRSSKFEKIIILKTYFQFLNIVTLKFETNSVKQFPKTMIPLKIDIIFIKRRM